VAQERRTTYYYEKIIGGEKKTEKREVFLQLSRGKAPISAVPKKKTLEFSRGGGAKGEICSVSAGKRGPCETRTSK